MPPARPVDASNASVARGPLEEAQRREADSRANLRAMVQRRLAAAANHRRSSSADGAAAHRQQQPTTPHPASAAAGGQQPRAASGDRWGSRSNSRHDTSAGAASAAPYETGDGTTNPEQYRLKGVRPDEVQYVKVRSRVFDTSTASADAKARGGSPTGLRRHGADNPPHATMNRPYSGAQLRPRRSADGALRGGYAAALPQTLEDKLRAMRHRQRGDPFVPVVNYHIAPKPSQRGTAAVSAGDALRTAAAGGPRPYDGDETVEVRAASPSPRAASPPRRGAPSTPQQQHQRDHDFMTLADLKKQESAARHAHRHEDATEDGRQRRYVATTSTTGMSKRLQQLSEPRGGRRSRSASPGVAGGAQQQRQTMTPMRTSSPSAASRESGHRQPQHDRSRSPTQAAASQVLREQAAIARTHLDAARSARPRSASADSGTASRRRSLQPAPQAKLAPAPSWQANAARAAAASGRLAMSGSAVRPHPMGNVPLPTRGSPTGRHGSGPATEGGSAAARGSNLADASTARPPLAPSQHHHAAHPSPVAVVTPGRSIAVGSGTSPLHSSAELSPLSDRSPFGEAQSVFEVHNVRGRPSPSPAFGSPTFGAGSGGDEEALSTDAPSMATRSPPQQQPQELAGGGVWPPPLGVSADGAVPQLGATTAALRAVQPVRRPAGLAQLSQRSGSAGGGGGGSRHADPNLSVSSTDRHRRDGGGPTPFAQPSIGAPSVVRRDLFQGFDAAASQHSRLRQPGPDTSDDSSSDGADGPRPSPARLRPMPHPSAMSHGDRAGGGGRYGVASGASFGNATAPVPLHAQQQQQASMQMLLSLAASSPGGPI